MNTKILGGGACDNPISQLAVHVLGFLQEVCGDGTQDSLHHSKVLFAVMSLKARKKTRDTFSQMPR